MLSYLTFYINAIFNKKRLLMYGFFKYHKALFSLSLSVFMSSAMDKFERSPLYEALCPNLYYHLPYIDVASCLLKHGADINQRGRLGQTILHYVASTQHIGFSCAQFLLKNGADATIRNDGDTPFDFV